MTQTRMHTHTHTHTHTSPLRLIDLKTEDLILPWQHKLSEQSTITDKTVCTDENTALAGCTLQADMMHNAGENITKKIADYAGRVG